MISPSEKASRRREQLKAAADAYFNGLAEKNFAAVPYANNVKLRTPLAPGGSDKPIQGKTQVLKFFAGLFPVLGTTKVVDHFINDTMTAILTKAEVSMVQPAVTLRVADLFYVNEKGEITEQENHYDSRAAV
ncbi:MAG: nuclear transport factor 2 family protein [Gammaproteobacteria bacterium]